MHGMYAMCVTIDSAADYIYIYLHAYLRNYKIHNIIYECIYVLINQ